MISVHSENSDDNAGALQPPLPARFRGWILFDAHCNFCRQCVSLLEPIFAHRGFVFLPLQTPWVRAFFHLPEEKLLGEMRLLLRNNQSFGGADAVIELAKSVWWAWPLVAFAHLPAARPLLRAAYRAVAARRNCLSGSCSVPAARKEAL